MSTTIQGLDVAGLAAVERNAVAILTHVEGPQLAQLKNLMHVGFPAIVGPTTLAAFLQLCQARGLDLSPEGVSAFKRMHQLGDEGANHGAIGAQTAEIYFATLFTSAPTRTLAHREVTARGMRLVENFEGYEVALPDGGCRAYRDQVGVPTIGWGHTAGVRMGMVITRAQAEACLHDDLAIAEEAVDRLVKVSLNTNEFDALVSFTFNVGTGALGASLLLRLLNAGDRAGAAAQFGRWVNGNRGPLPGLIARRAEERALFEQLA